MEQRVAAEESNEEGSDDFGAEAVPTELIGRWPFGPDFFLCQLHAFIRDQCPTPEEHLPAVEVHLADGEVLDVCHVMGLTACWVALAVHDVGANSHEPRPMRTELAPYSLITRITIRSGRKELAHVGFEPGARPSMWTGTDHLSPEETLRAAAGPATSSGASKGHCGT